MDGTGESGDGLEMSESEREAFEADYLEYCAERDRNAGLGEGLWRSEDEYERERAEMSEKYRDFGKEEAAEWGEKIAAALGCDLKRSRETAREAEAKENRKPGREEGVSEDEMKARLRESLRAYFDAVESGFAQGYQEGKSKGFLKGARLGYVEGYGEAFDLVMEGRNPGRRATVESRKAELEEALGFRTDNPNRGARGYGGGRSRKGR